MLTKRKPDLIRPKAEPTPFAAKAKDLGELRNAVVDAASIGVGLWISYLFVLFYFAIAAGAVTHRDLLLENPVKLPFLNIELPLRAFFSVGPLVFLVVHAYVLLHFVLFAGKISAFDLELQAQVSGNDARARLRRQLPSNIFVQSLAGPREVRTGVVGFLLRRILDISLVVGPIALLVLFQLQFLAYHSEWITWWQRIAVVVDLVLLWILWPRIARGQTAGLVWVDFKRAKVQLGLLVSILPALLVVTIATFPGEWLEMKLPPVPLIPTTWGARTLPSVQAIRTTESRWATLHELLVAGNGSLWPNVLVLPNVELGDRVRLDAEGKIAISSKALSLRNRSLDGAVLSYAHLRKADFRGASLARANFIGADLREAKFDADRSGFGASEYSEPTICWKGMRCTQLQDAVFALAQLQGASFKYAQLQGAGFNFSQLQGAILKEAQLQGATFFAARLEGASFDRANLQGASFEYAQLQGANLNSSLLQGATLDQAGLQGANLEGAELQGASLYCAQLQGTSLFNAHLQGASLDRVFVWRTEPSPNATAAVVNEPESGPIYKGLDCLRGTCDWSEKSYAALKRLIENSPSEGLNRDRALQRIEKLETPPYVVDEVSAKGWTGLAEMSARSADLLDNTLASIFKEIGCAANGAAPYVIAGLRLGLFHSNFFRAAEVAATVFLDKNCPAMRGMSEDSKTELRKVVDQSPGRRGPGAGDHRMAQRHDCFLLASEFLTQ
jgi:uncharacterized protein YjbI with pentapeptide repeats